VTTDASNAGPWLVFARGHRAFAVAASDVRFVIPTPRLSGFPVAFERLLGVFAHRGRIYPLLDPNEVDGVTSHSSPIAIITASDTGDIAWVADVVRGFEPAPEPAIERIEPSRLAQRAREALRRATHFA
jgi:chemotaxis signal transduction protein